MQEHLREIQAKLKTNLQTNLLSRKDASEGYFSPIFGEVRKLVKNTLQKNRILPM